MADRSVSVVLKAQITDYMAKFSAAGKAARDLGTTVDTSTGRSQQGFASIGRGALLAGGAMAAGFGLAVKASMDFDKEMSQLQAASGATGDAMKDLRQAAIDTGRDTVFSASQAAEAETALAKAGVSAADILGGALTGTVNLAAAGQIDLAEAAETAASAMTQFGLAGSDVSHVADLLAAGAGKAQGSVHDLGMALNQSGLVASQTGLTIEETVGALSAFASAGLMGSDAGTSFKTMLQRLNPQSAEAAGLMDRLNLSAYDSQGQFVGLAEYAGRLQDALGNMSAETRNAAMQTLFGSDAVRAASVVYSQGAEGVQEWIDKVNDAGYAQAFAAVALDNLAGDLEQLKGSIETALIQTGGKANGVLREMVQDVTAVVNVYNKLPGPVQAAATGLLAVGAATTLAGGAALVLIPKWSAMNEALKKTQFGAVSAGRALSLMGKATGVGVGLFAAYEGVTALKGALDGSLPSVEGFTSGLTRMGVEGSAAGSQLLEVLTSLTSIRGGMFLPEFVGNLDAALTGLVTSGKADLAEADFKRIRASLEATGMTVEEVTALFPSYGGALKDSAAQAKLAGTGVDDYGNAVGDAAEKTKQATDAAKDYADQSHALTDPVFAMNKALGDLTNAQDAAREATRKYGAESKEAKQANLDLAAAALQLKAASADLTTAVATGNVTMAKAKATVLSWRDANLITNAQAKDLIVTFRSLIGTADHYSDLHPHVDVTADTHQAFDAFARIDAWLRAHHGITIPLTVQPTTGQVIPHGLAAGGPVYGPGTATSDSVPKMLSNGEFVVRADGSNLNDALAYFGANKWGASSGGVTVIVNNPVPEPASVSVPLAMRERSFVRGERW